MTTAPLGPRLRRGLLILLIAPLLLFAAQASATNSINVVVLDVDDSEYPVMRVTLTIADSSGRPISGLGPSAFTIDETGSRASVTRVETAVLDHISVGVVMVMDVSASMRGVAIEEAKNAAMGFVQGLHPNDQAAVLSFSSGVNVLSPLTPDREASVRAISGLEARGDTALYEAVTRSIEFAHQSEMNRQVVVLLSDGREYGGHSRSTRDEALAIAAAGGVPFYVIGLGPDIDRPFLQDLARQTGGAYLDAPTPASMRSLYDQLSRLLRTQYVVTLRSNAPREIEERNMRLVVITSAGGADIRLEYRTRREILPPTPVPSPTPVIVEEPAVVRESSGGGLNVGLMGVVFSGAVLAAVSGGIAYRWAKDRRDAVEMAGLRERAVGYVPTSRPGLDAPVRATESSLSLVIKGPDGEQRIVLDDRPITIGSSKDCDVRLDDGSGVATEHARIWSNGRKLMYHELGDDNRTGGAAGWMSLSAGEEFDIGSYRVRVENGREA